MTDNSDSIFSTTLPKDLGALSAAQVKQIQAKLEEKGYFGAEIDGKATPKLILALANFKRHNQLGYPRLIDSETIAALHRNGQSLNCINWKYPAAKQEST